MEVDVAQVVIYSGDKIDRMISRICLNNGSPSKKIAESNDDKLCKNNSAILNQSCQ